MGTKTMSNHLSLRKVHPVKKESPNMGTKTVATYTTVYFSYHSGEKRIPKHGDENRQTL